MSSVQQTSIVRTKPLMSMPQILIMNLGFFGIQYSFGMQQTAVNPVYEFLGANPHDLPILNLAGPITGLLIQPLIGALSDRTWSPRWGRRKPFFLVGALGCSVCLFLFPFVTAVWMAVILLWLLDASNNTAMEPYRAFIADKLPPSQLGKGFLAQSFFTGLGITLANVSLFVFQKFIEGGTAAGIPYWVLGSFMLGAVCSITSVLISVLRTPEIPPSAEELAALRAKKGGFGPAVKEIGEAIRDMPTQLRKLALVYFFQWYGMVCYWQFIALTVAQELFPQTQEGKEEAVAWTGLINGWYNIVTFSVAFALVAFAKKRGAKLVHCVCLLLAAIGLMIVPSLDNQYLIFIPMIGLGIAWASIMGVPYIMAVRMIPSTRFGVYMGIINMMIVVPMLIQSVTFGWLFEHLLGGNPSNAIRFAAVFLAIAGVLMLWIKEPRMVRDVDDVSAMPMAGH
ncbi:putative major facilitator superfamily transporter [Microlunatus phosphovorus NM-1]|uniref:Putative major facilitator superfamily transporter n=1 Tax=Microlunatus phosphovorus (strain ATCC 700054 / DSM 10555 / JCM 9379 / NBRC 101784 / NCIMB 13414 / VKM Ac-1990 / NM-1) TaxID=1032480 RepID=F5XHQ7_MICPN|nr:MFS transporter [Microlunatus phosphovorus]BAK33202.1 putative major facilitator superfamily transporter [Microlunatus phosphovorus NM-1]